MPAGRGAGEADHDTGGRPSLSVVVLRHHPIRDRPGFGYLARRLYETQVDWTPMLSRYAVVVPAMVLWAALALPVWLTDPLARNTVFGAPGTVHLLVLGVVGFVVLGTLYHIVPFVVWVHRYSDLLGTRRSR